MACLFLSLYIACRSPMLLLLRPNPLPRHAIQLQVREIADCVYIHYPYPRLLLLPQELLFTPMLYIDRSYRVFAVFDVMFQMYDVLRDCMTLATTSDCAHYHVVERDKIVIGVEYFLL